GPERQRPRQRLARHRGHCPLDGHHGQRLTFSVLACRRSTRSLRNRNVVGGPGFSGSAINHRRTDMQHSKAYRKSAELVDHTKVYAPAEAIKLAKDTSTVKFDATVEVAMRLGVDPRKADQMVRGTVNLPNGTGKTARVIVFAAGEKASEAEAAGADEVGSDELIARIQGGW